MIWECADKSVVWLERALLSRHDPTIKNSAHLLFCSPNCKIENFSNLCNLFDLQQASNLSTVLLAGWNHWGTDLASHLRGAFSFALYDSSSKSVYVARDISGICPLYYYLDKTLIVLGGSSRKVRALLKPDLKLNPLMLADFLNGVWLDNEHTFFQGIKRLKPANWMCITSNAEQKNVYWSVSNIGKNIFYANPAEEFARRFNRAVAHYHTDEKTALMLSGGLDSSAIAVSLKEQKQSKDPLTCVSLTYPETEGWADKTHLETMRNYLNVDLETFPSDLHDPLSEMAHWLKVMDGPYLPYGHSVSFRLLRIAKDLGCSYVFSGHGGDEVISYGYGRANELAASRQWLKLWKESAGISAIYKDNRLAIFYRYLAHIGLIRRFQTKMNYKKGKGAMEALTAHSSLSNKLQRNVAVGRYSQKVAAERLDHTERTIHEEALTHPLQSTSLEVFALCAEASGVKVCLPFFNQDLIEFCLSLPSEWKMRNGLTRYILRQGMKGKMPDTVRLRQDKFDFGNNFKRGLLSNTSRLLDLTDPTLNAIEDFVNIEWLAELRTKVTLAKADITIVEAFFLWRVAILSLWLEIMKTPIERPKFKALEVNHSSCQIRD